TRHTPASRTRTRSRRFAASCSSTWRRHEDATARRGEADRAAPPGIGAGREENMRLAVKLTAALVFGIVCVMVLYAWVQISNEVRLSEADAYHARRSGLAWLGVIESVWESDAAGTRERPDERHSGDAERRTPAHLGLHPARQAACRPECSRGRVP